MDIAELRYYEEIQRSERGDHQMLIDLLRSEEELPRSVRLYIAEELSRPPRKRFARKTQQDLDVEKADREILRTVAYAKACVWYRKYQRAAKAKSTEEAKEILGSPFIPIERITWDDVSNRAALDLMAEEGYDVEEETLKNAINRWRRDKGDWDQWVKQRPLLNFPIY